MVCEHAENSSGMQQSLYTWTLQCEACKAAGWQLTILFEPHKHTTGYRTMPLHRNEGGGRTGKTIATALYDAYKGQLEVP